MKKNMLKLTHRSIRKQVPSLSFNFPEPTTGGKVMVARKKDNGEGWTVDSLEVIGIGWLLSYRQYAIDERETFISQVSESVICLSIRWGNGGDIGYRDGEDNSIIEQRKNYLFWQGDRQMEENLLSGEHIYLDLFVRPECLAHLDEHSVIRNLLNQSDKKPFGEIEGIEIYVDERIDDYISDLLTEIANSVPDVERFSCLCEHLLMKCLGEYHLAPPVALPQEVKKSDGIQVSYQPNAAEKKMLLKLDKMDRAALLMKFDELLQMTSTKKKEQKQEIKLNETLKSLSFRLVSESKTRLAHFYINLAQLMELEYNKETFTSNEQEILKKAICETCILSFELVPATPELLVFYAKWSNDSPLMRPIEKDQMIDILSRLMPSKNFDFTKDDSERGRKLLAEQIKETFGFKPMSYFTGEKMGEKPQEIAELYNRLMDKCAETLELTKDAGIRRSDIVRELDSAYEANDLITLLQIEIEQFTQEPNYIEKQDAEHLKWLVVALLFLDQDCETFSKELRESSIYSDLQLFHELGDSMPKFKREIKRQANELDRIGILLAEELKAYFGSAVKGEIFKIANYILNKKG